MWENILTYLEENQFPKEYEFEELGEKYLLLDWVACQLIGQRPIKTKQLFLYGPANTQKTLLFHFLSKAIRICQFRTDLLHWRT